MAQVASNIVKVAQITYNPSAKRFEYDDSFFEHIKMFDLQKRQQFEANFDSALQDMQGEAKYELMEFDSQSS